MAENIARTGADVDIKYKGLSFEMAQELATCEQDYFTWDEPVPFKELNIYPVRMKDYQKFFDSVICLTLNRKDFPEQATPELIKKRMRMSDLDFLLAHVTAEGIEGQLWTLRFVQLLEIVFHIKNGVKCPHCGKVIPYTQYQEMAKKLLEEQQAKSETLHTPTVLCPECGGDGLYEMIKYVTNEGTKKQDLVIDGQAINSKEYDRLRNIILFQNLTDYRDTSYIDPSLKKDFEEHQRIKSQSQANLSATLEKKIVALKVGCGYSNYEDIFKLTIRKFLMEMTTMDDLIMYKLLMQARMSGFSTMKENPEHWIYKESKDIYADAGYVGKDTVVESMKQVT